MPEIEVRGGNVVYELVGPQDGEVLVLNPGGRFSKDYGGVHELAQALAAGGKRVLLWDRPNCGASDIQLFGRSESHMRAEVLGGLLDQLGIDKVVATGGSGGARDMIVFTLMHPGVVTKLAVWSIVGGTCSTMGLAGVYLRGSILVDPPWHEDAWERAVEATCAGRGALFDPWQQAAPVLLDFINQPAGATALV